MSYLEACSNGDNSEQAHLDKAVKNRTLKDEATALSLKEILESENYAKQLKLANHWVERLNANTEVPPLFLNGLAIPREDNWLQIMSMRMSTDLQLVQQGLFMGTIDDDMWVPQLFLEGAATRRNLYIYPDDENTLIVLDVNKLYTEHKDLFEQVPVIE
ncbi:hypothetical protein PC116_g33241, partial [Phytophthora cactorum]